MVADGLKDSNGKYIKDSNGKLTPIGLLDPTNPVVAVCLYIYQVSKSSINLTISCRWRIFVIVS